MEEADGLKEGWIGRLKDGQIAEWVWVRMRTVRLKRSGPRARARTHPPTHPPTHPHTHTHAGSGSR